MELKDLKPRQLFTFDAEGETRKIYSFNRVERVNGKLVYYCKGEYNVENKEFKFRVSSQPVYLP